MADSNGTASRPVFIYELTDPRTGCVRYIGKTVSPKDRLSAHIRAAKAGNTSHCKRWIAGIVQAGMVPVMGILEEATEESASDVERYWIGSLRICGADLTNGTPGGDGMPPGYVWPESAREKLSKALKGTKRTPEQRETYRAAFARPDIREKRREITTRRMADPAARAVAQQGMSGKKMTEEAKRKISESWTPERKAAHAAEKAALDFDDRWRNQLKAALAKRWAKYRETKCSQNV